MLSEPQVEMKFFPFEREEGAWAWLENDRACHRLCGL